MVNKQNYLNYMFFSWGMNLYFKRINLAEIITFQRIFLISSIIFLLLLFKLYLLFAIFVILDLAFIYFKEIYKFIVGTNFILIGAVIFASRDNLIFAISIAPFYLINRMLLGKFKAKFVFDVLTLILAAFSAYFLRTIQIQYLVLLIYGIKTIFDIFIKTIFLDGFNFEDIFFRFLHLIVANIFMFLFSPLLFFFW
jgi:hypothetical protein